MINQTKEDFLTEISRLKSKVADLDNSLSRQKLAEEQADTFYQNAPFIMILADEYFLNEIYLFDVDTLQFTQVNKAVQKNLGYTIEEFLEMTPLDIKPEFSRDFLKKLLTPLFNGSKEKIVFEALHKRKDFSKIKT